jgi:hypothetical protein
MASYGHCMATDCKKSRRRAIRLSLPKDVIEDASALAAAERRSLSSFVEVLLVKEKQRTERPASQSIQSEEVEA